MEPGGTMPHLQGLSNNPYPGRLGSATEQYDTQVPFLLRD
jgi:hypothetical protein